MKTQSPPSVEPPPAAQPPVATRPAFKRRLPPRASNFFWKNARKIVVLVFGVTIVLIGIAGLILPVAPGWIVIFAGLGLLATEFAWARWILKQAKVRFDQVKDAAVATWNGTTPPSSGPSPKTDT